MTRGSQMESPSHRVVATESYRLWMHKLKPGNRSSSIYDCGSL